jgi:class 3 adenylate cyclase/tetratricopeptide (TPR) repeat protein
MSTKACAACGAENPADALFCGRCGSRVGRKCSACSAVVAPDAVFCTSCGSALEEAPPLPSEERKTVSVLFVDLVGFTEQAERLDPEEVRALLVPYHERARTELERFGGTVEKFIGDAVVALFGAPIAHEDDPERAVRSGLAVRDAMVELEAGVRVGITTGEALVKRDAKPLEGEAMAAGDVVNTAARLQTAAPVDGILVDAATHRATEHAIEYAAVEPVTVKGKAAPVPVWQALAPRARLGVDIAFRGAAPLLGREDELKTLRDALLRARRDRTAQLVTLVGPPGMGKSRLVYELWSSVETDPELVYWRQGRSLPYGHHVSFWALSEMAKAQAGILESDDADAASQKLAQAVAHAMPDPGEARWVASHLRPLVGLGAEVASGDRRDEAFAAWRRFFEALAEQRPLVLVFEDLHWADDGLLDFIDQLVEWATDVPLLVVCTARPELLERRPRWGGGKRNATAISLAPLADDDVRRLVESLVGEPHAELTAHAGGNPLYAEEYARMLVQSGNGGAPALPDSVQGIIAARLDTLPLEEKVLVQDAAVLGKVFWVGELGYVTGLDPASVSDQLRVLDRKEFVRRERRSSIAGETAYVFRHVLVRDVAYSQIPRARRIEKHQLAAAWIERLGGDRREDLADVVAHHYLSALELARAVGGDAVELTERARLALRDAGDRAARLSAFSEAARLYEAAVALWPDDEQRGQLLLRLGRSLYHARGAGAQILAEAAEELLDAGDRADAAEGEMMLAELAWLAGRRDDFEEHRRAAENLVADEPPSPAKAYVLANVSRFLSNADQNEAAIRAGFEAFQMTEELGLDELRAHTLITIGTSRALIGDLGGLVDLERAVELARQANSAQSSRALNNLASTTAHLGNLERAFELYAEARREAERFGHAVALRWLEGERVAEYYWRGLWDEALQTADAHLVESAAGTTSIQELETLLVCAKIQLARDDAAGAETAVNRALELARAADDAQSLFPALAGGAQVALAANRMDEASALVDALLRHWDKVGRILPSWWLTDLAVVLEVLDRGSALGHAPERVAVATPWFDAAVSAANGAWLRAAGVFAEIGSLPDEAFARLRATEQLSAAGRRAEAEDQLSFLLAFYRRVGAAAYIQRAENAGVVAT